MTGQCQSSTSSQATEIWKESTQGRAWKCGLFFTPHISFWEEGICDRVTWCLGPFSLVITHISLSSLFLSSSVKNISISPPPFVGLARTRKVTPFHCGDGGGFDTPTRPIRELNHPPTTANLFEIPRDNIFETEPQSKFHLFTRRHCLSRLLLLPTQ